MTFGVENRDTVEIYRNPESLRDEQVCEPDAVLRGNFAFDRISIANFDGTKIARSRRNSRRNPFPGGDRALGQQSGQTAASRLLRPAQCRPLSADGR